jgi:MtN3 and saliva related transmembrane protein
VIELIGYAAAVCTTVAFLPQLLKAWQTRSTADISLVMFLVLVTGIVLWLTYGVLIRDFPLIAANAVTLLLAGAILALKLRHK